MQMQNRWALTLNIVRKLYLILKKHQYVRSKVLYEKLKHTDVKPQRF